LSEVLVDTEGCHLRNQVSVERDKMVQA